MEKNKLREYAAMGLTAVISVSACILIWFCFQHWDGLREKTGWIMGILAPFVDGIVLTFLTSPVYNRVYRGTAVLLRSRKAGEDSRTVSAISRISATICAVLLVLIAVTGLFMLIIPQLYESVARIIQTLPVYWDNFSNWAREVFRNNPEMEKAVLNYLENIQKEFTALLSADRSGASPHLDQLADMVYQISNGTFADIVTSLSNGLRGVLTQVKNWLLGLIIMIYLLNIKETLIAQIKMMVYGIFNTRHANEIVEEMRYVNQVFGGFVIGKLVDSLLIGIICFIFMNILQMPYPMLLSAIIGVTNIIPFFGPFIGAVPTALLVFLVSPVKCLTFLLFIFILQQFDGNILGPRILGNSTGLSSFWVMFSILFFGGIFGFVGMIIGVPLFAVIANLVGKGVSGALQRRGLPLDENSYMDLDHIEEHQRKVIRKGDDEAAPAASLRKQKQSRRNSAVNPADREPLEKEERNGQETGSREV